MKHAKLQVVNNKLAIVYGIHQLILTILNLLGSPNLWNIAEGQKAAKLVESVFQLTEVYNNVLESSWSQASLSNAASTTSLNNPSMESLAAPANAPPTSKKSSTSSLQVYLQIMAANRNDSPLLRLSLKPLNGTRLLQLLAQRRSTFAAPGLSKTILSHFYQTPNESLNPDYFEGIFSSEESGLRQIDKALSQYPGLLGRAAVKKTDNGDQRLSRSARIKMHSYFHQLLWTLAGEHAEDLLLWSPSPNIPVSLYSLDTVTTLRLSLSCDRRFQGTPG